VTNREFSNLMRRTMTLGQQLWQLKREFDDAFVGRYGVHYSDLDEDELVEFFDYNPDTPPGGLAEVDQIMARHGCFPGDMKARAEEAEE
jgi:hypothetical protein